VKTLTYIIALALTAPFRTRLETRIHALTAERAESLKAAAFFEGRPGLLPSDLTRNNNRAAVEVMHALFLNTDISALKGKLARLTPVPALTEEDLRAASVRASRDGADLRARNYMKRAALAESADEKETFLKLHREESRDAETLTEALARFGQH